MTFDPIVRYDPFISIAHELLAEYIGAVVYYARSVSWGMFVNLYIWETIS